tara:strand:- start:217 stop:450 length:234 start_codon:yes stop_codon:yes gene_type:complete
MKEKKHRLNLEGFKCPFPVLKISKKFKEIKKGDVMVVKVDDPRAENDIEQLSKKINLNILNIKKKGKLLLQIELRKY